MEHNNNIYLASKPRYEILDGLRGVAADFFNPKALSSYFGNFCVYLYPKSNY